MTEEECSLLLAELAASYRTWETRPGMLDVWHQSLGDLPFDAVRSAARAWRELSQWPPAISDLRRGVAAANGLLAPNVEVAWQQARDRVPDAHPAVIAARDAIGDQWRWSQSEESYLRRDFAEFYEGARQRLDGETLTTRGLGSAALGEGGAQRAIGDGDG